MRLLLIPLLMFSMAEAQIPKNAVLIGTEGITVSSTTGTAVTYKFGAGGTLNTVANPSYPLLVNCLSACPQLGNDPYPGKSKSLYAMQQQTAYTVTLVSGAVIAVPGLAVAPPPARTVLGTFTCVVTMYSDFTFQANSKDCKVAP